MSSTAIKFTAKQINTMTEIQAGKTDPEAFDGRVTRHLINRGFLKGTNKLALTAEAKRVLSTTMSG